VRNAEKAGSTTREPEKIYWEMLTAIGDSLRELTCSDDGEDEEDEEEDEPDRELGKLSKDDDPGWVMALSPKPYTNAWMVIDRSR